MMRVLEEKEGFKTITRMYKQERKIRSDIKLARFVSQKRKRKIEPKDEKKGIK